MTRPAVFLDRDGVLNEVVIDGDGVRSPRSRDEFVLIGGVGDAVALLSSAGFLCVVVTNQPDVTRGRLSVDDADWFTRRLLIDVGVDAVRECRHDNVAECECRKPRPGLLIEAAKDLQIDLSESWMVGDRWVDVAAAASAGVRSILVVRPWSWLTSSSGASAGGLLPDECVGDLAEAVGLILGEQRRK